MNLKHLIWADIYAFGLDYHPPSPAFWKFFAKQIFFHSALVGVIWYRYGHWAFRSCRVPIWRHLNAINYMLWLPLIRGLTGVDIDYEAIIGPGVTMAHGHQVIGNIRAGAGLRLGDGCLVGDIDMKFPTMGSTILC